MTTSPTLQLLNNVSLYHMNPNIISSVTLQLTNDVINQDLDIVDPTNPWIYLLGISCVHTSAAILEGETLSRNLNPKNVITRGELFRHISDGEIDGLFSTPAKATFEVMIPLLDVSNYSTLLSDGLTKQLIIPKDFRITVLDTTFSIDYPITIKYQSNGNIKCYFSIPSTNQNISLSESNIINSSIVNFQGNDFLNLSIPMVQYKVESTIQTLSNISDFNIVANFTDKFYNLQAYIDFGDNAWTPVNVSFNTTGYDIKKATVLVEVNDTSILVSVPDIYNTQGLLGKSVRIDVYTTKGNITSDLSLVQSSNFSAGWEKLNPYERNVNIPLNNVRNFIIYSTDTVSGGIDEIDLETLRNKVIYRYNKDLPIRQSDVNIYLDSLGYTVTKLIDNITNRVYLASKSLSKFVRDGVTTSIKCTTFKININDEFGLAGGDYQNSILVSLNGRTTLNNTSIYRYDSNLGTMTMLTDTELNALSFISNADKLTYLTTNKFFFSPFHYVLDYTSKYLRSRAYYLNEPSVLNRYFIEDNKNTFYNIVSKSIIISYTNKQFIVTITTSITNITNNIACQLRYSEPLTGILVYLDAVVTKVGNEAIIVFTFNTNLDITDTNKIEFINFYDNNGNTTLVFLPLISKFDLYYLVQDSKSNNLSNFDNDYNTVNLGSGFSGAIHETITLEFGKSLSNLYNPCKNILKTSDVLKYTAPVYATYTDNVYEKDTNGNLVYTIVGGVPVFNLLHSAGDTKYDTNGNPVIIHNIGDSVLDQNGQEIPNYVGEVKALRQIEVLLIDADYKFGTTDRVINYLQSVPTDILSYLNDEIIPLSETFIEQTDVYFKPKGSINKINVNVGNGIIVSIDSDITFNLTFIVPSNIYNDSVSKNNIKLKAKEIISNYVDNTTLSIAHLIQLLLTISPDEILGIDMKNFINDQYSIMTLVNPNDKFTIKESLVLLANGDLDIRDNINIYFKEGLG